MPKLILSLFVLSLLGCGDSGNNQSNSSSNLTGRISPSFDGPAELEYCSDTVDYTESVIITGTAQFESRILNDQGLGPVGTPQAIQFHEVRVTNKNGKVIQCGQTNNLGKFSLSLPVGSDVFYVSINSRAYNEHLKASLFNAPEQNKLYSLTTEVKPTHNQDIGFITAKATDNILGAAFNILDQVRKTNDYLRTFVGNCSQFESSCPNFEVTEKVLIYWEKGFNPASYYGQSSGISYYLPEVNRLFILGGDSGDTDYEDTDHFDNSIIIHEYTHFLEDVYSKTDSPGGVHNGNQLLDPRLAWSEGFANFIQAAVLDSPYYIDTRGNVDGSTNYIFKIKIEQPDDHCAGSPLTPGCDVPSMDGEGNFREFSVTRFLWDTIDTNNDSETITDGFVEMWSALTSPLGFQSSNYHFRSIGLLHAIQDSFTGKTDWDPLRQDSQHLHVLDDNGRTYRHEYALPLSSNCSGMDESITPINDDLDNGSYDTSHLLANNDFFLINHSGGPLSIIMRYQDDDSSGVEVDMDLILYKEKYVIGNEKSMVSKSQLEPDNDPTTQEAEHISVNDLAAGVYLLQIMVYTALFEATIPGTTNYELTYNGSLRCR